MKSLKFGVDFIQIDKTCFKIIVPTLIRDKYKGMLYIIVKV